VIRRLSPALAALALLVACNQGAGSTTFRFSQPSAVAVFHGFARPHSSLWPYTAVANSAQDELILFDAVEDKAVSADILLRPLSIPVPDPRPALVASARFQVPADEAPRPDLLAVVSAGSSDLQLIRTWHDPESGASSPGLAMVPGTHQPISVPLGGEVLALLATPAVNGSGQIVDDRVRVIAALTGGALAVAEFQWTGDPAGVGVDTGSAAPVGPAVVQPLGFEALSLAVDPGQPRFLYAATLDPIPPSNIDGVAQLDMGGAAGGWTVQALSAHAPTRLVAAFSLKERNADASGTYDQFNSPAVGYGDASAFAGPEVARVYAWRDPASCGPRTAVECGIAVLDPGTRDVLADPWGRAGRFLPPIAVPAQPVALVAAPPPLNPPSTGTSGLESASLMLIRPVNPRLTTAAMMIPAADGRVYVADLARWEVPSNSYEVSAAGSAGVTAFKPSSTSVPRVGFYEPPYVARADQINGLPPRPEWDPNASATAYIQTTPGFTAADNWTVTFQGYLPDFAVSRVADVEDAGGETLRVAFQAHPPGGGTTQVVNLYDPALGIRVGDIVEFWTGRADTQCPDTSVDSASSAAVYPVEGKVVSIDQPDAAHPGGSLVVQRGDCVPIAQSGGTACVSDTRGPWTSKPECWTAGLAGPAGAARAHQVRIRGGSGAAGFEEFVVAGSVTGYAGRAASSPTAPTFPSFSFSGFRAGCRLGDDNKLPGDEPDDCTPIEADLVAQCPLIPYPTDPLSVPACDADCRTVCEGAAIARRARRLRMTSVACYRPTTTTQQRTYCETYFAAFVAPKRIPDGPALAFSLGWRQSGSTTLLLVRDTRVAFTTKSGFTATSRFGGGDNGGAATQPTGGFYFDRTAETTWNKADQRGRVFVPYVGNLVLDVTPSQGNTSSKVLR
jgi:hypothetical protein